MTEQSDLQRQVNTAFEAFRESLQEMLAAEARKQVDSTLARLQRDSPTFQVEGIKVDVVVSDLTLTTTGTPAATTAAGSAGSQRKRQSSRRKRGAGGGAGGRPSVREELLAAFPDTTTTFDTAQLNDVLARKGVTANVANIHQQLRRLVLSGDLERVGRGLYRRRRPVDKAA